MKLIVATLVAASTLACASGNNAPPSPASTSSTTRATVRTAGSDSSKDVLVRTRVGVSDSFSPRTGDAALQAFVPDVAAADSGGECNLLRTGGSGATLVIAYFPTRAAPKMQVNLAFDSAGHLIRFNERRGIPKIPSTVGMSDAQRDSTIRVAEGGVRSTTVSLDYGIDQGIAMNRGGGRATSAVLGTVRSLESLAKLGPPTAHLERTRRLCGV